MVDFRFVCGIPVVPWNKARVEVFLFALGEKLVAGMVRGRELGFASGNRMVKEAVDVLDADRIGTLFEVSIGL